MPTKINGSTGIDKIQDGVVSETKLDDILGDKVEQIKGYNYIINGNFDIWQRGTSQTTRGYGSDDRWFNHAIETTRTHSRQSFDVGEVFPDGKQCPKYFSRTVVSSVAGAGGLCSKQAKLEDVSRLAGRKITLAFYARADAPKNITIEFIQNFGTGGTPSLGAFAIKVEKILLSTTFQRFVITCDMPSIAGKTLGADNNSYTQINFWFAAGSDWNFRTDSLGHQSGTFDIACVSLVEGDIDIKPIPRSYGEELALCQRYYSTGFAHTRSYATAIYQTFDTPIYFHVSMRTTPTLTLIDGGSRANTSYAGILSPKVSSARHEIISAGAGDCRALGDIWTADAEL